MGNYEIFEKVLEKTFPEYTKLFDIDDYETLKMDANNNYEGFCKLMRENEERRSLSRFISCMLLQEVIDEKFIIDIINTLFKKLFALVNLDENEGLVDLMSIDVGFLGSDDAIEISIMPGESCIQSNSTCVFQADVGGEILVFNFESKS